MRETNELTGIIVLDKKKEQAQTLSMLNTQKQTNSVDMMRFPSEDSTRKQIQSFPGGCGVADAKAAQQTVGVKIMHEGSPDFTVWITEDEWRAIGFVDYIALDALCHLQPDFIHHTEEARAAMMNLVREAVR